MLVTPSKYVTAATYKTHWQSPRKHAEAGEQAYHTTYKKAMSKRMQHEYHNHENKCASK